MEDYKLDLMIGEGPAARSIRIDLPPFTLVGATTRTGLLATPLRDRFGILAPAGVLQVAELEAIVLRGARAARRSSCRRRRARDRAPRPRHAARGDPAAAPGARLRHRRRHAGGRRGAGRRARCASSRSTTRAWTASTAATCARSRELRRRPGRRSRPWRLRCRSSATRWRRRSSPSCCSRGCSSARRAAAC